MAIDFTDLGIDLIAGTIFGAVGAVVEYTAATLASGAMPALFTSTTIPLFAGITGLGLLAGAIFTRIGSKMYKASASATS